jgi:RNA polymerase sigma-70 factor, ECF subfamily
VDRYVHAWEEGDVPAIVSMLTAEATFAMPPLPRCYRGREAIAAFLAEGPLSHAGRWRHLPVSANGQAAVAVYSVYGEAAYAHGIELLTLDDEGAITAVTAFLSDEPFARFGLPRWIRAGARI